MAAVGDVLQLISTTQHPYNVNTDIWGLKKWKVSCLEHQWKHAQPWLKKKERKTKTSTIPASHLAEFSHFCLPL